MNLRRALKKSSFNAFLLLDRIGVHVLPKHYYTPVADYQWLRQNKEIWAIPAALTGVRWNLDEQLGWIQKTCQPYYREVANLESFRAITAGGVGPGFGPIESQVLHCFIRSARPSRVVEIGSGVSTAVMLRAAELNARDGHPQTRITCIEPYPRAMFRNLAGITHIEHFCQTVPEEVFTQLGPGDLLFIDSSHALKAGSDVLRIYLDLVPKLGPGVTIHIHDVYLPYLYSPEVLTDYFGWQETALVLALLTNNERLSILACLSALHHLRPGELVEILTDYRPRRLSKGLVVEGEGAQGHFPSSLWLVTS